MDNTYKNKEQITIKSIKDIDIEIESYFKKNSKIPLTVLWVKKEE